MEGFSILSTMIDDFANGRGRFKELEISKRQKKGWELGIVPNVFIQFLRELGLSEVAKVFMSVPRYQRTVDALELCIQAKAPNAALLDAMGKLLGNFRYKMNDSRANPQTILAGMMDVK
jgi:hypothetical protein